jgi:predicted CopG family antitoxin
MSDDMTTLAVRKTTMNRLDQLKQEWHTRSFDETIQYLITKVKKRPNLGFGSLKGSWPEFEREEIDRFD